MKQQYEHPGTEPPVRKYSCIGCSQSYITVKGQWNYYAGRWLMSFNCPKCDTHQEAFVSGPRRQKPETEKQQNLDELDD